MANVIKEVFESGIEGTVDLLPHHSSVECW